MEPTNQATVTQEVEKDESQHYELAYWLDGRLSPQEWQAKKEKILSLIQAAGGKIESEKEPELRELAYPIRKQTQGYFGLMAFSLHPEAAEKLRRTLEVGQVSLLRFLMVRVEEGAKAKAAASERERAGALFGPEHGEELRERAPRPQEVREFREAARPQPAKPSFAPTSAEAAAGRPSGATEDAPSEALAKEGKPEVSIEEINEKLKELLG